MSVRISVTEKSQLRWQNLHYSWISTVKQANLGERAASVSPHTWGANSSPNTSGRFAAFCTAPIQRGEKLDKQDVFMFPHPPGRGFILHRLFCQITRAPVLVKEPDASWAVLIKAKLKRDVMSGNCMPKRPARGDLSATPWQLRQTLCCRGNHDYSGNGKRGAMCAKRGEERGRCRLMLQVNCKQPFISDSQTTHPTRKRASIISSHTVAWAVSEEQWLASQL